jgi:hypothetical protein
MTGASAAARAIGAARSEPSSVRSLQEIHRPKTSTSPSTAPV